LTNHIPLHQGILLVYDVTSMASFQTLMRWIQTIRDVRLLVVILAPNFLLNTHMHAFVTHTSHTHAHTHTHTHTLVTHMYACRLAWSTLAWWW